jgi:hypothetical protein
MSPRGGVGRDDRKIPTLARNRSPGRVIPKQSVILIRTSQSTTFTCI